MVSSFSKNLESIKEPTLSLAPQNFIPLEINMTSKFQAMGDFDQTCINLIGVLIQLSKSVKATFLIT